MAFADPQTITVNGVAKTLVRVSSGDMNATYKSADDEWQLRISHQKSKGRIRRMVRLDRKMVAADPLTAENTYQTAGVYQVIDEPEVGIDDTNLGYQSAALDLWMTTGTNTAKILASES